MDTIFYGIIAFMFIVIFALIHRNKALARSYDSVVSEEKSRGEEMVTLSKFVTIAGELAQLRKAGLKDRKYFFETVLDCASIVLNSGRGSLMIYDELRDDLSIIAARNISKQLVDKTHVRSGEGIAGKAFRDGEIIYVSDPSSNPQYSGFDNYIEQKDPFLCLPIKTARRTYCVLNLHLTSRRMRFSDLDLKLLTILADEAGLILENDRLKKALNPNKAERKPSAFEESPDEIDARERKEEELRRRRMEGDKKEAARAATPATPKRGFASMHSTIGGGFAPRPIVAPAPVAMSADVSGMQQQTVPEMSFGQSAVQPGMIQPQAIPAGVSIPTAQNGMQVIQVSPEQYVATPQMFYVPVQMQAQGGVQYIRVMPQGQFAAVPAMPTGQAAVPPPPQMPQQPQSNMVPPPPPQNIAVQPVQYVAHPMPNVPVTAAGLAAGNIAPENVEQETEHLMQRFRINRGSAAQPQKTAPKTPAQDSGTRTTKINGDEVIIDG